MTINKSTICIGLVALVLFFSAQAVHESLTRNSDLNSMAESVKTDY